MILQILKKYTFRELIRKIDNRYGLGRLETLMASNWFNPLATFYLNIRSFKLSHAWKMPIFVFGRPRFYNLSGRMEIEGRVSPGMIVFNRTRAGSPSIESLQSEIMNQGRIVFHGCGIIGTGNKIRVAKHGVLEIGQDFKITDMVNVGVFSRVIIGEKTRIAHRCQILDSNYHYVANLNNRTIPKCAKPITIGRECWICNSSTVTGGTTLPDFTIVASNSFVNKDFRHIGTEAIIGGIPAKLIKTGFRRIMNNEMETSLYYYYDKNPNCVFKIPENIMPETCSHDNL